MPQNTKKNYVAIGKQKKAFDRLGQKRLPKITELQEREHELIAEKQERYAAYRRMKAESKQLQEAQANVESILNHRMLIAPQKQSVVDNRATQNL